MKPIAVCEIAKLLGSQLASCALIKAFSVDSRLTQPGDLFFALPGGRTDGHFYLQEVAAKGAVAAVVQKDYKGDHFGIPLLPVSNVLDALQKLAANYLSKGASRVIAVTGSLGKTTTKDFIGLLLGSKFKVSVSPGNNNSQIGLPLAILNHATLEEDYLILEMGMTHPGQLTQLLNIAPPYIALVTTVALVHACNFNSIEEIAKAKAEIFSHPKTQLGIFHKESDYNHMLSRTGTCRKLSFSRTSSEADFFLEEEEHCLRIRDAKKTQGILSPLNLPGFPARHNFLAAVAVARQCGMSWEDIFEAQVNLKLPERRLQFIEKFGALFINDSYNASEMSVKAALSSLPMPKPGAKRIAVLGEMVELGKFSEQCHLAVAKYALDWVDQMLCFGEGCLPILRHWQMAGRPVVWSPDREGIVKALRERLDLGDVVLLKGSCSKGVWKVLDEL